MGIAMPNLNLLMSIGSILLLMFWLYKPGLKKGITALKSNKIALAMIGLFLIHVVWLINTSDFDYASKDLRVKLPLFIFALVLGSMKISRAQVKFILLCLSLGIWFATIQAYINYIGFVRGLHDYREIVQGISHIRLSLLMVTLVAGVIYFWRELSKPWKVYAAIVILNVLVFFNVLQSLTGIVVLAALVAFSLFYYAYTRKAMRLFWSVLLAIIVFAGISTSWSKNYYEKYFVVQNPTPIEEGLTAEGNPYQHVKENKMVSNGHYIFTYLALQEMAEAWNERSILTIDYDKQEHMEVAAALTRYLSSKGLRKDKAGVMAMSDQDIRNVELGFPSVIYAQKHGLLLRIHTFFFSIHQFKETGNASGLSFFQRTVYWKIASNIISENFWTGVGTGDVKQAFADMYEQLEPNLDKQYRLRSHNQFMALFVAFGLFGFLYFIWLFILAFRVRKPDYFALAFFTVALLSCLVEDTLETQAGITFFSFFFALMSKPFTKGEENITSE